MKRIAALAMATILITVSLLVPVPEGLSREGLCVLLLMAANVICWIGDVAPKSVVGIAVLILLPLLGIAPSANDALQNFMNPIIFFLLAASALSAAVKKSSLPHRIMSFFLRIAGRSTTRIVLAFMVTTALISSIMTDLAACILCAAVALSLFNDGSDRFKDNCGFVKCIMIGIPAAALAGGTATPIGSASNITMMGLLSESIGMEVSWARWMSVGIPVSLISLLATWLAMVLFLRPRAFTEAEFRSLSALYADKQRLSGHDVKTIVLIGALFVLWTFSDAIGVNTTITALAGMVIAFLPGVDLLTWNEFKEEAPWDLLIMLGYLFSLAAYLLSTGAVDWISSNVLASTTGLSPYLFLVAICAMIAVMRGVTPAGAPIVSMLTPMFVTLAAGIGIDPFIIVILMSVYAQITFLCPPCDALYLVTYATNTYSIRDVVKFGVPLTAFFLLAYSALVPVLVSLSAGL